MTRCAALGCDEKPAAPPYLPFCARHWLLVPSCLRRTLLGAFRPQRRLSKTWQLAFLDARTAVGATEQRTAGVMVLLRLRDQITERIRVRVA